MSGNRNVNSSSTPAADADSGSQSTLTTSFIPILGACPSVTRDKFDLPRESNQFNLIPLHPHKHPILRLTEGCDGYSTLKRYLTSFSSYVAAGNKSKLLEVGTAHFDVGMNLYASGRYDEARLAFEYDFNIASKYLSRGDTIASLRQISACLVQLGNFPLAITYCEQAATNAARSSEPKELQGAMTALAQVCQSWIDQLIDSEPTSLSQRQRLITQMTLYYKRALEIAESLPLGGRAGVTLVDKRKLQKESHLNYLNALQQQISMLSESTQEVKRKDELDAELSEDASVYTSTNFNLARIDLFGMSKRAVFRAAAPRDLSLLKQAKSIFYSAQALCYSNDKAAIQGEEFEKRVSCALVGDQLEIDEVPTDVNATPAVDLTSLSSLRHSYAAIYEACGEFQLALPHYFASIRLLNYLPASRKSTSSVVINTLKSLRNIVLLAVKLKHWTVAHKMARQMNMLIRRWKDNLRRGRIEEDIEDDEVKQQLEIAQQCEALVAIFQRKDNEIEQVNHQLEGARGTPAETTLIFRKREILKQCLIASSSLSDNFEWRGRDLTQMANCERDLWRQLREQRAQQQSNGDLTHDRDSVLRESHILISLSQSVTDMCELHLPRSAHAELERMVCSKYWTIVGNFLQTPLYHRLIGASPHWEAMTKISHATALVDLGADPRIILQMRQQAFELLQQCERLPLFTYFRYQCLQLASSVCESFNDDSRTNLVTVDLRAEWSSRQVKLQREWKEQTKHQTTQWIQLNQSIEQVYEGSKQWTSILEAESTASSSAAEGAGAALATSDFTSALASTLVPSAQAKPIQQIQPSQGNIDTAMLDANEAVAFAASSLLQSASSRLPSMNDDHLNPAGCVPSSRKRRHIDVEDNEKQEEEPIEQLHNTTDAGLTAHIVLDRVAPTEPMVPLSAVCASLSCHSVSIGPVNQMSDNIRQYLVDPISPVESLACSALQLCHTLTVDLCSALTHNHKYLSFLSTIDLSFCRLDEESDWISLFATFPCLPRLQQLNLSGTFVGDWCLPHLKRCIDQSTMLQKLTMNACMQLCGDESTGSHKRFVDAVTCNRQMKYLSFRGCPLSARAITMLLRESITLTQLESLDLSYALELSARLFVDKGHFADSLFKSTQAINRMADVVLKSFDETGLEVMWLQLRQEQRAVDPSALAEFSEINGALTQLGTASRNGHSFALKLLGWSNVGNLFHSSLIRILESPSCVVTHLEVDEVDWSETQLLRLFKGVEQHHASVRNLKKLVIRSSSRSRSELVALGTALSKLSNFEFIVVVS